MFDTWNDQVGPRLEQMVRTDAFADQAAWWAEMNRRRTEMAEAFSRRLMHFWNMPTASDIAALKRQVEALDRQLHRVNKTLQEVRDAGEVKRPA
jgi:hypothetical protein